MGADFRWMMCAIDDATLEKVAPLFASPAGVQLDGDQRHAYERFRDAPETLLPRRMVSGDGEVRIEAEHARHFSSLFALQHYKALPGLLGIGGRGMLKFLSGETSPVEVLYFSLGAGAAARLPGFFGNMAIRSEELPDACERVRDVVARIDDAGWTRARRIISICSAGEESREHDAEIAEVFASLPSAMEQALRSGGHFVSSAFWLG